MSTRLAKPSVREWFTSSIGTPAGALSLALPLLLLAYFFGFQEYFERAHGATVTKWLTGTWNKKNELEHAWLVPPIIAFLLFSQRKKFLSEPIQPDNRGWILLGIATLLFLASVRTLQPRLAVGAFPFFILGIVLLLLGYRSARTIAVPVGLIYFTIPVPGLTQATNGLQVLATKGAYHLSQLCGIDVIRTGNQLASATDKWGFDVAEGCSGLRSLLALTLVAAIYAYTTQRTVLKGFIVFLSSIPLAIIANAIRVATILILAEYVDPRFAGGIYHDWAGFLFFLVIGLAGIILIDKLANLSASKVATRQISK